MPKNLLFEIGFADLPCNALPSETKAFSNQLIEFFLEQRLNYSRIRQWFSQKRLGLLIEGIASPDDDDAQLVRGPKASAAYDINNLPIPAAKGFASAHGVEVKDLIVKEVEGEKYLFAVKNRSGNHALKFVAEFFDSFLAALPIMGAPWRTDCRFPFPPLYFIAMLDGAKLDMSFEGLPAGNCIGVWNDGRVFFKQLNHALDYPGVMRDIGLIEDLHERKKHNEVEFRSVLPDGYRLKLDSRRLLQILTFTEACKPFIVKFDEKFLELPEAVLHRLLVADSKLIACEDARGNLVPVAAAMGTGKKIAKKEVDNRSRKLNCRLKKLYDIWAIDKQDLGNDLCRIRDRAGDIVSEPCNFSDKTFTETTNAICKSWCQDVETKDIRIAMELLERSQATSVAKLMPGTAFSIAAEGLRCFPELKKFFECFSQIGSYFSGRITVPDNPLAIVLSLALLIVSHAEPLGGLSSSSVRIINFLRAAKKKIDVFAVFASIFPDFDLQKDTWIKNCAYACLADNMSCLIDDGFLKGESFDPLAFFEFAHYLEEKNYNNPGNIFPILSLVSRFRSRMSQLKSGHDLQHKASPEFFPEVQKELKKLENFAEVDYVRLFEFIILCKADMEAIIIALPPVIDDSMPSHCEMVQMILRINRQLEKFPFSGNDIKNKVRAQSSGCNEARV